MKKKLIGVIMQAFYGNRTYTQIAEEDIDFMLQGNMTSDKHLLKYEIDRAIVRIPGTKCVLVYNKYQEEDWREQYEFTNGKKIKPYAVVPELGIEIYSRCFICRMSDSGEFESIESEDKNTVVTHLAE